MAYLTIHGEAYSSPGDGGEVEAQIMIDDDLVAEMKAASEEGEFIDHDYISREYPWVYEEMEEAIQEAADRCNAEAGYPDEEVHSFVDGCNIEDLIDALDSE